MKTLEVGGAILLKISVAHLEVPVSARGGGSLIQGFWTYQQNRRLCTIKMYLGCGPFSRQRLAQCRRADGVQREVPTASGQNAELGIFLRRLSCPVTVGRKRERSVHNLFLSV